MRDGDGHTRQAVAKKANMPGMQHHRHKSLNNHAENGHQPTRRRERQMQRFKSAGQAQRFLSVHDQVEKLFRRPVYVSAVDHRYTCARAFQVWTEVTGIARAV
jgi:putative transposase